MLGFFGEILVIEHDGCFCKVKHWALMAITCLIVATSGPTVSKAQTRRDSLVNPGQSGPQGIVGGPPGPSVGRTQPSFGAPPRIDFVPADPSNLNLPPSRTPQDLPLPLDFDPSHPRPRIPPLKPWIGRWCPRLTGRLGRRAIPRGTRRDPTVPPPSLASEAASHPPPCARATSAPPSKSYSYT